MSNKFTRNKIFKNFSILTISNLLIHLLSIISSIRLARLLKPEGYGLFNLVTVQATFFSIIAVYGLRLVIIRHIARNKEDARRIFKLSNNIRIISTLVAIIAATIYNLIQVDDIYSVHILIALIILIVFQTLWDTIESVSFGFEKMGASGIINLIFTIIWVFEVYFLPNSIFSVKILIYIFASNQLTKTLLYNWWLNKNILSKQVVLKKLTFSEHKELLVQGNYFFILAVFTAIQNQVPVLFLQFNSTLDQIGIFNLGYKLLSPLQMILNTLLVSAFPLFARLAFENPELFAIRIKSLLNTLIVIGVWAGLCFALLSADLVRLLYGEAYLTSAKVILTQCWYLVLYSIFCLIGTVLNSFDKQKTLALLSVISGLISIPFFYYGTKHGAIGLAISFVVVGFVNMTYHWVILRGLIKNKISLTYSFFAFSTLILLALGSSFYSFNLSLVNRISIVFVLSFIMIFYLYKFEYTKMKAH